MKAILEKHFDKIVEISALMFIFIFATVMLAAFKNEEMARWIENGAIIAILARTFGARPSAAPGAAGSTTIETKSTEVPGTDVK